MTTSSLNWWHYQPVNQKRSKSLNPITTNLLHQLSEQQIVPGVSYAMKSQEKWQQEVFGFSQLKPQKKLLVTDQLYDLASLTKVIGTTTVILHLVTVGKLNFEDSVKKFLPDFYDQRVTIRELLTHTAAITGYIPHRNQLAAPQLKKALFTLHTGNWLGKKVEYSDVGLIFLGEIIESFYHKPVQQVIVENVLQPLQMTNSTFEPLVNRCVPTTYSQKTGLLQGKVHDPKARILKEHCGSAGLFAPLSDLMRFVDWILADKIDPKLFSSDLRQQLFADQTPTHELGRSFGWDLRYDSKGQACIYHTGYTGTFMLLDLATKQALIVLTNRIHPDEHNEIFLEKRDQIIATYLKEKDH